MPNKKGDCRHCGRNKWLHGRGLCSRCYHTAEIRNLYPRAGKGGYSEGEHEPTEEELEAMIAEQMENLPRWWRETEEREQKRGTGRNRNRGE